MNATRKPGYALATILILLGVALFGVGAIISVSGLESKISRSHEEGVKAYYVAEAGVEDGLWKVHNEPTYTDALAAGTLNVTYYSRTSNGNLLIDNTSNDVPALGQGFKVNIVSTAPHYATLSAYGYSDNQSFTAQREVKTTIFLGAAEAPEGSNAIMSGGPMSVNGGTVHVIGGDWYSSGPISLNGAHINAESNKIKTTSSYSANGGNVASGGIQSSNQPPVATSATVPGFDFRFYKDHNNKSYTGHQFNTLIRNSGSTITLSGPVTYISNALNFSRSGKTINITGMLVIDGSFSLNGSTKINVLPDPVSGKSGIFVAGPISLNGSGPMSIEGLLYSSGALSFNGSSTIDIDGSFFAAGSIQVNSSHAITVTYNAARTSSVLDVGTAWAVGVQHWEEEY